MGDNLQQAIDLIKSGKKSDGGRILAGLVKANPDNELAWQWLASCVAPEEQKRHCLSQALRINPQNETAKRMLDVLDFDPSFESQDYTAQKPVLEYQPLNNNNSHDVAINGNNQTGKTSKNNSLLLPILIILVSGVLILYFVLQKYAVPDASYCIQAVTCSTFHSAGNTTLFGTLTNTCDKPVDDITLKVTVTNQLDNSILDSTTELQEFVMDPNKDHDFDVTIKNSYFGPLINCYPEAQIAHFVK